MARAQWKSPASEEAPSLNSPFRHQLWLPSERPSRPTPVTGATRTPQIDLSGLGSPIPPAPAAEVAPPAEPAKEMAADPVKETAVAGEEPAAEEAPPVEGAAETSGGKKKGKKGAEPKAGE